VTIATALSQQPGLAAGFERWVSRMVLPGIYREELQRLAEHAEGRRIHEPVPKAEG
jgi:prophage antirepressor-like protein